MKKNGFTLIELLAVIVILAIIATIAVPIVLNIIEDTKNSATIRSADFYLDAVELSIAKSILDGGSIDGEYEVKSNGNICKTEDNCITVEVSGDTPDNGSTITITNGQISSISLNYDNKTVIKDTEGSLVFSDSEDNQNDVENNKITLVQHIKNLYSNIDEKISSMEYEGEIYDFGFTIARIDDPGGLIDDSLGEAPEDLDRGNIRYYGANANNYVDIGDKDTDGNIIFWRIIGVFKDIEVIDNDGNVTDTQDLVKVVRAEKLSDGATDNFSWSYDGQEITYADWTNSTLMTMLNSEDGYYGAGDEYPYYNFVYDQEPTATILDLSSTGLSNSARDKVEKVRWALGEYTITTMGEIYDSYQNERAEGSTTWDGKIALMYPSDYGYASYLIDCFENLSSYYVTQCYGTNWMYNEKDEHLLTSEPDGISSFYKQKSVKTDSLQTKRTIRPVLYLKADTAIVETVTTEDGFSYYVVE